MAIENLIYYERGDLNQNPSRKITTVMDGKNNPFTPKEVRMISAAKDISLGGHWREYSELLAFLGEGKIILEDIDTKERREYSFSDGSKLFVPPRIAYKIYTNSTTYILTCSPEETDRDKTHKYEIN